MTIYFIQEGNDGPIKIGYAYVPEDRLQELQTAHHKQLRILRTISGDRDREHELHKQFADLHIRGEWFRPEPLFLEWIDGLESQTDRVFSKEAALPPMRRKAKRRPAHPVQEVSKSPWDVWFPRIRVAWSADNCFEG